MMNMSYCRQENTLFALKEALGDVEAHINEEAEYEVSDREIHQFSRMVEYMFEFLSEQELIDFETCDLDRDRLEEICNAMAVSYRGEDDDY